MVDETPAFANLVKHAPVAEPIESDESIPEPESLDKPSPKPASQQQPAAAPTATKTNAEITREKWLTRLVELLTDARIDVHADQLLVAAKIGKTADLLNLGALTDKQLRAVVNTMDAWAKAGELDAQVTEILNTATLAEVEREAAQ